MASYGSLVAMVSLATLRERGGSPKGQSGPARLPAALRDSVGRHCSQSGLARDALCVPSIYPSRRHTMQKLKGRLRNFSHFGFAAMKLSSINRSSISSKVKSIPIAAFT